MRHNTVIKSKSKNRPYEWTQAQIEAHAGIKPNIEQQMVVSWDNVPKESIDNISLPFKLNNFLINLSVSLLTRRNCVPEIRAIAANFTRRFRNFKIDSQKLFDFFNDYVGKLFEVNRLYPLPEIFQVIYYEPRKIAFISLRKEGVKSLKELLEEN